MQQSRHSVLVRWVHRKVCSFYLVPFKDTSLGEARSYVQTWKSTLSPRVILTQALPMETPVRNMWMRNKRAPVKLPGKSLAMWVTKVEILIIIELERSYALPNLYPIYSLPTSTQKSVNPLWLLTESTSTQDGHQMGILMSIFLPTFIVWDSTTRKNFSFSLQFHIIFHSLISVGFQFYSITSIG